MREYARVSVRAIEEFKSEVSTLSKLTSNLAGCELAMAELYSFLDDLVQKCESSIHDLNIALAHAKEKKAEYDALVNQLNAEKAEIVRELSFLRAELAETPKYYTEIDSEGEEYKVRNPEYDNLKEQQHEARQRLDEVNQSLSLAKLKLDRARTAVYNVKSQTKEITNAHKQLCESKERCIKIQAMFSDVRTATKHQANEASEILSRLIIICRNYMEHDIKKDELLPISDVQATAQSADYPLPEPGKVNRKDYYSDLKNNENSSRQSVQQMDDNGKIYRVNDELIKNAEFQVNGYTYKTDNNSRTIHASGKLRIPEKHDRTMERMNVVGKGDQHATDDRGHLIGHQFYGSDKLENLIPQEQKINQGSYARLETYLADLVNTGKEVYVCVTPFYGNTRRPEAILYYYCVDGHSSAVFFPNTL